MVIGRDEVANKGRRLLLRALPQVVAGVLPINHEIIHNLQDIFNLLPNLNVQSLVTSFSVNANDQLMVLYLASLIRSVIALHNLINNKVRSPATVRALLDFVGSRTCTA